MKISILLTFVALAALGHATPTSSPLDDSSREDMYSLQTSQEDTSIQSPEDNTTEDMDDSEERDLIEEVEEEMQEAFREYEEALEIEEAMSAELSRETNQETSAPRSPLKYVRTQKTKCSLEGVWQNQHGSQMILNMTGEGHIAGEYRTAVETKLGSAGNGPSLIRGAGARSGASTFGFSVVWRGGASTTTWAGQCLICDGREILDTTWLLVGEVAGCEDSWMSTRVGKDTFYRIPKGREHSKDKGHLVPRN